MVRMSYRRTMSPKDKGRIRRTYRVGLTVSSGGNVVRVTKYRKLTRVENVGSGNSDK